MCTFREHKNARLQLPGNQALNDDRGINFEVEMIRQGALSAEGLLMCSTKERNHTERRKPEILFLQTKYKQAQPI